MPLYRDQVYDQRQPCPKCGSIMILEFGGMVYDTLPPMYPTGWWCACGYAEAGPTAHGRRAEDLRLARWEQANRAEDC